ncbi:hypothetical protein P9112_000203 [Eukaryota sp. TZLM1-RC]
MTSLLDNVKSALTSITNVITNIDSLGTEFIRDLSQTSTSIARSTNTELKNNLIKLLFVQCTDHTTLPQLVLDTRNERSSKDLVSIISLVITSNSKYFSTFFLSNNLSSELSSLKFSLFNSFLQSKHSATKQAALSTLYELIFSLQEAGISPNDELMDVAPSLSTIVKELLRQSTMKISGGVRGEVFKVLGKLFVLFPEYMDQFTLKFAKSIYNHGVLSAGKDESSVLLEGCLLGLSSFFSIFDPDFKTLEETGHKDDVIVRLANEAFDVSRGIIRKTVQSLSERIQTAVPLASLVLIRSSVFQGKIFFNFFSLIEDLFALIKMDKKSLLRGAAFETFDKVVELTCQNLVVSDVNDNQKLERLDFIVDFIDTNRKELLKSLYSVLFVLIGHVSTPLVRLKAESKGIIVNYISFFNDFKGKFEATISGDSIVSADDVNTVCQVPKSLALMTSLFECDSELIVESSVIAISLVFSTLNHCFYRSQIKLTSSLLPLLFSLNQAGLLDRVFNRSLEAILITSLPRIIIKSNVDDIQVSDSKGYTVNYLKIWNLLCRSTEYERAITFANLPRDELMIAFGSTCLSVFRSLINNILASVETLSTELATADVAVGDVDSVGAVDSKKVFNSELFCRLVYVLQSLIVNNAIFVPIVSIDLLPKLFKIGENTINFADCWIVFDCIRSLIEVNSAVEWSQKGVNSPLVHSINSDYLNLVKPSWPDHSNYSSYLANITGYLVNQIKSLPIRTQVAISHCISVIPIETLTNDHLTLIQVSLSFPVQYLTSIYYNLKLLYQVFLKFNPKVLSPIAFSLFSKAQRLLSQAVDKDLVFNFANVPIYGQYPLVRFDFPVTNTFNVQSLVANILVKLTRFFSIIEDKKSVIFEFPIQFSSTSGEVSIDFSPIVPHILRLADSKDKKTRISAFECLHSITVRLCSLIVNSFSPSSDHSDSLRFILPKILFLASSGDTVARQLFRDLAIQFGRLLIYIQINREYCKELPTFIEVVIEALSDQQNASLRNFAAAVLSAQLFYLVRQAKTENLDLVRLYDLFFTPLIGLSRDPDLKKRLGVIDLFLFNPGVSNVAFYRIFMSNSELSSKFSLTFFGSLLKMLHDDPDEHVQSLFDGIKVFLKITEKHCFELSESNSDRVDFDNLNAFCLRFLESISTSKFRYLKEVLRIMSVLLPLINRQGENFKGTVNIQAWFKNHSDIHNQLSLTAYKRLEIPEVVNNSFLETLLGKLYLARWLTSHDLVDNTSNSLFESAEPGINLIGLFNPMEQSESGVDIVKYVLTLIEILRFSHICQSKTFSSPLHNLVETIVSRLDHLGIPPFILDRYFERLSYTLGTFLSKYQFVNELQSAFSTLSQRVISKIGSDKSDEIVLSRLFALLIQLLTRDQTRDQMAYFDPSHLETLRVCCFSQILKIPENPNSKTELSSQMCIVYLLITPPDSVLKELKRVDTDNSPKALGSLVVDQFFNEFCVFLIEKSLNNPEIWELNPNLLVSVLAYLKRSHKYLMKFSSVSVRKLIEFCREYSQNIFHCSNDPLSLDLSCALLAFLEAFPHQIIDIDAEFLDLCLEISTSFMQKSRFSGRRTEKAVYSFQLICNFAKVKAISLPLVNTFASPLLESLPANPLTIQDSSSAVYIACLERFDYLIGILPNLIVVNENCLRESIDLLLSILGWYSFKENVSSDWNTRFKKLSESVMDKILEDESILISLFNSITTLFENSFIYRAKRIFFDTFVFPIFKSNLINTQILNDVAVKLIPVLIEIATSSDDVIISRALKDHNYAELCSFYSNKSISLNLISNFYHKLDKIFLKEELTTQLNNPNLGRELIQKFLPLRVTGNPPFLQDSSFDSNIANFIKDCLFSFRQAAFCSIVNIVVATAKLEKQEKLVDAYVLSPSAKHPIWSEFLLNSEDLPVFKVETTFETEGKRDTSTHDSLITESSLSLSSSQDHLFGTNVTPFSQPVSIVDNQFESEFELDFFNSITIMPCVLAALDWLPESFKDFAGPFKTILKLLGSQYSLLVRLFFLKVILNRQSLFVPFIEHYLESIIQVLIDETTMDDRILKSPGIHYFLRDSCLLLIDWANQESGKCIVDLGKNNPSLASSFIAILISRFVRENTHNYAVIKNNLEIIGKFLSFWAPLVDINFDSCIYLFNQGFKGVSDLSRVGRLTMKDRSKEVTLYVASNLVQLLFDSGYNHSLSQSKCSKWSNLFVFLAKSLGVPRVDVHSNSASAIGSVLVSSMGISDPEIDNLTSSVVNQARGVFVDQHYNMFLRIVFNIGKKDSNFLLKFEPQFIDLINLSTSGIDKHLLLESLLLLLSTVHFYRLEMLITAVIPQFNHLLTSSDTKCTVAALKLVLNLLEDARYTEDLISLVFQNFDNIMENANGDVHTEYSKVLSFIRHSESISQEFKDLAFNYIICFVPKLDDIELILPQLTFNLPGDLIYRFSNLLDSIHKTNVFHTSRSLVLPVFNSLLIDAIPVVRISNAIEGSYTSKKINLETASITGLTFFSQFFSTLTTEIGGTFDEYESLVSADNLPAVLQKFKILEKSQEDKPKAPRKRFTPGFDKSLLSRKVRTDSQGVLRKSYRTGEFVDLDLSTKDLVEPLLYLSFNDESLTQSLFRAFLCSILPFFMGNSSACILNILSLAHSVKDKSVLLPIFEILPLFANHFHHDLHQNLCSYYLDTFVSEALTFDLIQPLIRLLEALSLNESYPRYSAIYLSRLIPLYKELNLKMEAETAMLSLISLCQHDELKTGVNALVSELNFDFESAEDHYSTCINTLETLPVDDFATSFTLVFEEGLYRSLVMLGDWEGVLEIVEVDNVFRPPKNRFLTPSMINSAIFGSFSISDVDYNMIKRVNDVIDRDSQSFLDISESLINRKLPYWSIVSNIVCKDFSSTISSVIKLISQSVPSLEHCYAIEPVLRNVTSLGPLVDVLDYNQITSSDDVMTLLNSWLQERRDSDDISNVRDSLIRCLIVTHNPKFLTEFHVNDFCISILLKCLKFSSSFPGIRELVHDQLSNFMDQIPLLKDIFVMLTNRDQSKISTCQSLLQTDFSSVTDSTFLKSSFLNFDYIRLELTQTLSDSGSMSQSNQSLLIEELQNLRLSHLENDRLVNIHLKLALLFNQIGDYQKLVDTICRIAVKISPSDTQNFVKISAWFPLILDYMTSNTEIVELFISYLPSISHLYFRNFMHSIVAIFNSEQQNLSRLLLEKLVSTDKNFTIISLHPYKDELSMSLISDWIDDLFESKVSTFVTQFRFLILPELRFKDAASNSDLISVLMQDFQDERHKLRGYNSKFAKKNASSIKEFFKYPAKRKQIATEMTQTSEFRQFMNNSKRRLSDFSKILDDFNFSNISFDPNSSLSIVGISTNIQFLQSIRKPCRLSLIMSNGHSVQLIFKGGEDLRLDQHVQRFFTSCNLAFQSQSLERFKIVQYDVIPLTNYFSLITFIPDTEPLTSVVLNDNSALQGATRAKNHYKKAYSSPSRAMTREKVLELADETKNMVPKNLFRDLIEQNSGNSFEFLKQLTQFRSDVVSSAAVGYILGLGDRHLGNYLYQKSTGHLCLIDFGQSFDISMSVPIPEVIPFRFTQSFQNVFKPLDPIGYTKRGLSDALKALRSSLLLIMPLFESLKYSSLSDFKQQANTLINSYGCRLSESEIISSRIDFAIQKLLGKSPKILIKKAFDLFNPAKKLKMSEFGRLKGTATAINSIIVDWDDDDILDVSNQVDELIELACDENLIFRTFEGYGPYI